MERINEKQRGRKQNPTQKKHVTTLEICRHKKPLLFEEVADVMARA